MFSVSAGVHNFNSSSKSFNWALKRETQRVFINERSVQCFSAACKAVNDTVERNEHAHSHREDAKYFLMWEIHTVRRTCLFSKTQRSVTQLFVKTAAMRNLCLLVDLDAPLLTGAKAVQHRSTFKI